MHSACNHEEQVHAQVLVAIAPRLPNVALEQAWCDVRTRHFKDEQALVQALVAIVPRRLATERPQTLAEALCTARTIHNQQNRVQALVAIAPLLLETERTQLLAEALRTVRTIGDEQNRAQTLIDLIRSCQPRPPAVRRDAENYPSNPG